MDSSSIAFCSAVSLPGSDFRRSPAEELLAGWIPNLLSKFSIDGGNFIAKILLPVDWFSLSNGENRKAAAKDLNLDLLS
jgi:hypothetical protein